MIKAETNIFYKRGVVAIAFEASSDKDLPDLDLLFATLSNRSGVTGSYLNSKRFVLHISDMPESFFKNEDGTLIKNI